MAEAGVLVASACVRSQSAAVKSGAVYGHSIHMNLQFIVELK